MKRVVVTGLGAVSSLGTSAEEMFNNMIAGKNGISLIEKFDTSDFDVKCAGEIKDFDPTNLVEKRLTKRMDLYSIYSVHTTIQAHNMAGLDKADFDRNRYACIMSSGAGGVISYQRNLTIILNAGSYKKAKPLFLPSALANMGSGNAAIAVNAKGLNQCIVTACAAGTHSIGEATRLIQRGDADVVVAGAADAALCELGISGFAALHALSTESNPNRASIPFDAKRNGFVLGEGSASLILEDLKHAQARGAKIYAEVVGYGATCDASHMTSPTVEGPARAIKQAIETAGITPDKIDYINAHGTSTPINDSNETEAIINVFGDAAKTVKISATKSMIGHTLGAAGALEAVICVLALHTGKVPGTINSNGDDENCSLDYMIGGSEELNPTYVMSNSFGFGGHNGSLVFKKWEGK